MTTFTLILYFVSLALNLFLVLVLVLVLVLFEVYTLLLYSIVIVIVLVLFEVYTLLLYSIVIVIVTLLLLLLLLLSFYSEYKNIFYPQGYALPLPLPLPGGLYLLCKADGLLFTPQHSGLDLSFFLPLSLSSILVSPDSRVFPFLFHLVLYYKTKQKPTITAITYATPMLHDT